MSYTFSLSRRSLPVRCLCLLLIVLVLWCFFMVPRAGAVALEATTIAYGGLLVGTILVGAGVVFSSHGDMVKVGNAMYKTLVSGSSAIGKTISSISAWAVEHGASLAKGALRVGKDLYQGIIDVFNADYSMLSYEVTAANFDDFIKLFNTSRSTFLRVTAAASTSSYDVPWTLTYVVGEDGKSVFPVINGEKRSESSIYTFYITKSEFLYIKAIHQDNADFVTFCPRLLCETDEGSKECDGAASYSQEKVKYPFSLSYTATFDLAYPSDDYLVKMPDIPSVDTATGDVTYPNDTAYTKDAVAVPYPTDADGVKVPDIPYDKVVDQSTGKALDDTGTDTDTPSKPGEGTDTGSNTGLLQKILDLLKNFFDSPSDFRLNMDGFRNLAIADKFPFCIPFDLVDSIKQFAVTAKDFHFRIKLDTHYFKIDHEVDLSDMVLPFAFFRYMVLVWFVWMLMLRTRDLVKW